MNLSQSSLSLLCGVFLVMSSGCTATPNKTSKANKTAKATTTVAGCEVATSQSQQQTLLSEGPVFMNPPVYDFSTGKPLVADMTITYRQATVAGCPTTLRNYGGEKYDGRPVGPTMLIKPGQQYLGVLNNQLPKPKSMQRLQSHGGESTRQGYVAPDGAQAMAHNVIVNTAANDINRYKFNITNLHTHGWHVWPTENHDNIFAEVHPGDEPYLQQVALPEDHVAGTFWYHAHVHGSTTIQVSSGMAGALVVKDPSKGLDAIPAIAKAEDRLFVFQQLAYGLDGKIEDYSNLQQKGYSGLNRPVLVNGQVYPKLTIKQGELQRWRFVHGGITDAIQPMIVKDYQDESNTPAVSLNEIALDGLPTGVMVPINYADLAPGYRVDALVQLTDAKVGESYYLIDQGQAVCKTKVNDSCTDPKAQPNLRRVLAQINVVAGTGEPATLPSEAQIQQAKADYVYGQYKPMALDPFAGMGPLNDVTPEQLSGKTQIVHFMASNNYICPAAGGSCTPCPLDENGALTACAKKDGVQNASYMVCDSKMPAQYTDANGKAQSTDIWSCFNFNPSADYARTLALDTASRWYVSGELNQLNHTFHIHVNPFQVQRKWVNAAYSGDIGEQWVWKDTLRTPSQNNRKGAAPQQGLQQAELRSRYTDFTGAFVQHCHVLNHEDQGMMQVVEVVPAANDLEDNPQDAPAAGGHQGH